MIERASDAAFPKFALSELNLGRLVANGGFSNVFLIDQVQLDTVYDTSNKQTQSRLDFAQSCNYVNTEDANDNDHDGMNQNEVLMTDGRRQRFVVKMLRDDLQDEEHTKGVFDLAVEARFLKRLSHAHIVQMRGTANSDPLESRFFIILEMLVETLDDKLTFWRREINKTLALWCGPFGYCCGNKKVLHKIWSERMIAARSIASGLQYLHQQDLIYRDLKPENIGFDNQGQIKIFDFGLAKRLLPEDKNSVGLYKLTGNTGSLRYMAPEVALNQPYDTRADSYSFAIVFWQICALTLPYAGYNVRMHQDLVLGKGNRPKLERSWPVSWSDLMIKCWSDDIFERFEFDRIVQILDAELEALLAEGRKFGVTNIRAKESVKNKYTNINMSNKEMKHNAEVV